jgi:succinate dehydrogenase/fumarate reductase cytochrome b subunit
MSLFFKVMAFIVMLGVVGALFMGLRNMMKDGSANYSNKMMQLRVLLQAVAIVLLVAAVYFGRPS